MSEAQPLAVKRRACEECRNKKLKCTGEQPSCSRCLRENITCFYSAQKTMGRPKKRARQDDGLETNSHANKIRPPNGATNSPNILEEGNLAGFDAFESAFTPGGDLQPWLQSGVDWTSGDFSINHDFGGGGSSESTAVPALTPDDSSTQSPPGLNLAPELRPQSHRGSGESNANMQLDPALSGQTSSANGGPAMPPGIFSNCACLSSIYLTLNTLQTISEKQDDWFPYALHPLREAMQTASQVLSCEECPKRFITAIHNTHLLGTLLMSISERYGKVLDSITTECERAEAAGEKKKFRLADLNHPTSHLHAGGLGCVAAFSVNLSPQEWKSMCKKVVGAEVHGPEDGNECCIYLIGVFKQMEDRQERWHRQPVPKDFPKDVRGAPIGRGPMKKEDHLCLKLVEVSRKLIEGFDWS